LDQFARQLEALPSYFRGCDSHLLALLCR